VASDRGGVLWFGQVAMSSDDGGVNFNDEHLQHGVAKPRCGMEVGKNGLAPGWLL
jgi:hypothetical protein